MNTQPDTITIVVDRADGHHTVRAATVGEAMAILHELEAAIGFTRNSPVAVRTEGEPIARVVQPATPQQWRCPEHPQREPKLGRNGAYLYCSARAGEGYCQHTSKDAA